MISGSHIVGLCTVNADIVIKTLKVKTESIVQKHVLKDIEKIQIILKNMIKTIHILKPCPRLI